MKVLIVEKDGSLSLREVNKPRYNECQALVKNIACGMCGTDVKLIHRTFKGLPESMYPVILGHEGVGEVIEVGSKVTTFRVGDKVLLPAVYTDPENLPGLYSAWGGMSEYTVVCDPAAPWPDGVPDGACAQTLLEEDIDPVDAVMIITLREVLSSIYYFGIRPSDSVAVLGCGPVGLTFIKLLSLLGVKNIIACARRDESLEQAVFFGANHTINVSKQDVVAEMRNLFPDGVEYVLDAAGSPEIVSQGVRMLKDRGAVLCYGVPEKTEITIDFTHAPYNWSVVYQQIPYKNEEANVHNQIVEWIRSGALKPKDFISDYFDFNQAPEAYAKLLDRKVLKKGIVTF